MVEESGAAAAAAPARGRFLHGKGFIRRHSGVNRNMLLLQLAAQAALHPLHRAQVGIVGRTRRARGEGAEVSEGPVLGGGTLVGGDRAVGQCPGGVLAHALLEQDEHGHPHVAQCRGLHQEVAGELGEDAALLVLGHGVQGVVAVDEGLELGLGDEGFDLGPVMPSSFATCLGVRPIESFWPMRRSRAVTRAKGRLRPLRVA